MFCMIAKRGQDGRFLPVTRIGEDEIPRETILDFAAFVAKRMQTGDFVNQAAQPAAEKED